MSPATLFCLRAAASRLARTAKHTNRRFNHLGQALPTPAYLALHATAAATNRRAETAYYRYFDAAHEVQRQRLAYLQRQAA